ncbi:hypothetical protein Dtox_3524 [Desulfofarcimen acetoxidans DSM 771]|jgi:hypothetical protein|uniref:Uncharacterized protein n=1 Tax=Desulfofarcimen acetoxidans (strain ATCC 49208 / DSM 771 / KCTC 5769 / VKM B-1644 / 5575) TaxID=485916 RepID=C8VVV4_DESAS|nr:hypothetical protein [Desulfofarcimen acetoxidans]ACV64241.1 hypothetical protein Dtox_3524 [Desulfofarcimen acetoxidans DSM 771]
MNTTVTGEVILAAAGFGQLMTGLSIAEKQAVVVYGTMDGRVLSRFTAAAGIPVYFFETG